MSDQATKFLAQWEFEHITVVTRSKREEQHTVWHCSAEKMQ
jgi:hypothetical protein